MASPNSSKSKLWYILLLLLIVTIGLGSIVTIYLRMARHIHTLEEQIVDMQDEIDQLQLEQEELREMIADVPSAGRASRVAFRGATFDTYIVSLKDLEVKLYWQGKNKQRLGTLSRLRSEVESGGKTLLFGMNAGIFDTRNQPKGLYIEEGKELFALDQEDGNGNFYLKPNGVFLLRDGMAEVTETSQFPSETTDIQYATQSGPMLLIDGAIHPAFREASTNLNIRNGVGVIAPDLVVFAISNQPVNFFTFASLFKDEFGCENALYLDGAISQMYLPELDRTGEMGNLGPMIGITPK